MPAIDIDRDSAAEAAHRELAKPIYEHPSPIDRLINWIFDQLDYLEFRAGELPGGWFTILVTTLIVIAAAVLLVRIARRAVRTRGGADFGLFESGELTAVEHRAAAELAASQGNWSAAIRHRLRAMARQLKSARSSLRYRVVPPTSWQPMPRVNCPHWQRSSAPRRKSSTT
ncbi:Conserved membrane protein of uncharacterised function [Mycobacteroides abscessus]|nr:Conserved membrane protein of uncharacterised function [Mycobacteroides abscessus]